MFASADAVRRRHKKFGEYDRIYILDISTGLP